MGCKNILKKIFTFVDFFNSSQMLRYEQDNQYRTVTGGLLSIALIATILTAFASMIISTFEKTTIAYSQSVKRHFNPPQAQLTMNSINSMIGIRLAGYNLNQDHKIFDVYAFKFNGMQNKQIRLQPCSINHWPNIPQIIQTYNQLLGNHWLCIPINQVIKIGGKRTSEQYSYLSFQIHPCTNLTDSTKTCASQQQINTYLQMNPLNYFNVYSIGTIINPDQKQYLQHYIDDKIGFIFSKNIGIMATFKLKDTNIYTDQSILPFQSIKKDIIYSIDKNSLTTFYGIKQGQSFGTIKIIKGQQSNNINRQVQKISAVFSFIGGMIGAVLGLLFLFNAYTSFSFQLAIAYQVFDKYQNKQTKQVLKTQQQLQQKQMHKKLSATIFDFLQYKLYAFYRWCNNYKDQQQPQQNIYPQCQYIYQCRQQILNQLDVKLLMQRLIFLQYSMTFLFQDYQIQSMKLKKPNNPMHIRQIRKKMSMKNYDQQTQQPTLKSQNQSANNLIIKKQLDDQTIKNYNKHTDDINQQIIKNINLHTKQQRQSDKQQSYNEKQDRKCKKQGGDLKKVRIKGKRSIIIDEDLQKYQKIEENITKRKENKQNSKQLLKLVQSVEKGNEVSKKIMAKIKKDRQVNQQLQEIILERKKINYLPKKIIFQQ